MKKILLLGINARFTHTNPALRYLRNYALDLPYRFVIKEVTLKQPLSDILKEIWQIQPQILAISVYIWNVEIIKLLLPDIKKILPQIKLVLGGPEVSYNSSEWLEHFPEIDHIIIGAGENGFKFLLENLNIGEKVIKIDNPPFADIPFPYLDNDFPEIQNKYIYYEAGRGCIFRCSYCLSAREDQQSEFRRLEDVKKELDFLISKNARIIKFIDRTFNSNPQLSRAIWNYLSEKECDTIFHFEIHPAFLKEEDFRILQNIEAGKFQFEIGIQSVNPKAITAVHRKDNWEKSKTNILRLRNMGNIHLHTDLIVGLPFDTAKDVIRSFNEVYRLQTEHFQLGFLKILAGTPLAEEASKFEIQFSHSAPYQVLRTKWLSYEKINLFQNIEKLLNVYYNSGKFRKTLGELVRKFASPFNFFNQLNLFFEENHYEFHLKNWQKNALHLLEFAQGKFLGREQFFSDCLRYDWCIIAGSHFYPDFLRSEIIEKIKKEKYPVLKEFINREKTELKPFLKSAIFFKPVSAEYRDKFPKEKQVIVFFRNGEKEFLE